MATRTMALGPRAGGALVLSLLAACSSAGEPGSGALLSADAIRLNIQYDTVPPPDTLLPPSDAPVIVELFRIPNSAGYPVLKARVTATNLSDRPLIGTTGQDCWGWTFSVYDNPAQEGEPLWTPRACRGSQIPLTLPVGGTQQFPPQGLGAWELTNPGPGTYYLFVRLRGKVGADTLTTNPSGWLTEWIPAGTLILRP